MFIPFLITYLCLLTKNKMNKKESEKIYPCTSSKEHEEAKYVSVKLQQNHIANNITTRH